MIAEEVKQEETPAAEIKKEIKEGFFKNYLVLGKIKNCESGNRGGSR